MPRQMINMVGQKYGRLTVREMTSRLEPHGIDEDGRDIMVRATYCICDCDCGKRGVIAKAISIRKGNTRSCGCIRSEMMREKMKKKTVMPEWRREYNERRKQVH